MKKTFNSKKQTAIRGRSSALVVTIIVHVVLFLVAGTYVAMEVIERQEAKFEAKQIARPKMKLKKLHVPVKIKKQLQRQTPKLSQRMTAVTAAQTKSVDFKMPEMTGFGGGGVGVDLSGASLGGSLGFATTQLNVFGLKSSGEKFVFILDTSRNMLIDEVGGIPAYTIIKNELLSLIGSLPPTALFNVIVFDPGSAMAFSRELSPASDANIKKIKEWLGPLNNSKETFGFETLQYQGTSLSFEPAIPIMTTAGGWLRAICYAVQKGADSVYWLGTYGEVNSIHKDLYSKYKRGRPVEYPSGWPPDYDGMDFNSFGGGEEHWNQLVEDCRNKLETENTKRRAAGKHERVIPYHGGDGALVKMYYPSVTIPRLKKESFEYKYNGRDVIDYIETLAKKSSAGDRRSAMIGLKKKKMSLNVIHFIPRSKTGAFGTSELTRLRPAAQKFNGSYLRVKGLDAIQSATTTGK